jgi:hypothetical protein
MYIPITIMSGAGLLKMLSSDNNGKLRQRKVTVIISGLRPVEMIRKESQRFVFIDSRVTEKDFGESSYLVPLISDSWGLPGVKRIFYQRN